MNRTNIMRIRFDFSRNFDWYILNKIHSIYYKIVGKVCMNQSFILIDNDVKIGDIVTFFGKKVSKNEFYILHTPSL